MQRYDILPKPASVLLKKIKFSLFLVKKNTFYELWIMNYELKVVPLHEIYTYII
jgi:hypothetical protein